MNTIAAVSALAFAFRVEASFSVHVWRGETKYVNIPSGCAGSLMKENGAEKDGVRLALACYDDVAYEKTPGGERFFRPDVFRELPPGSAKIPTLCRLSVSPGAKSGSRTFGPMEVVVSGRVLPPASDWKYRLDLWQHPWAVARYFGVKPFSGEHYAKMEIVWRALADCGVKTLTTTILDLPWNHQCYDGYASMVGRVKTADGKWRFDWSIFDEYVEFGRKCGIGPSIACYTMCPWGYMASWHDENGEEHREKLLPGTPAFEDYWGDFLVAFAAHLKEKGWFDDTVIAMDERGPEDVKLIARFIQEKAPGMKISMAGDRKPSAFKGIKIDEYSQGLSCLTEDFLPELPARAEKGMKTTFYVCCNPVRPNTFMESPEDEAFWIGAYPVMAGFDGFLRWAANSWPEDPYKDASFKTANWKAGDTYLVYPSGELSSRMISLRAGIVAAEKMAILGKGERMKEIASRCGWREAMSGEADFSAFRREVESLVAD